MSADGNWEVTLNSPMGPQDARLSLETDGTRLLGRADSPLGEQSFDDGTVDGDRLSWSVKVKKPMPMTVKFEATVDGDAITGTAKAGMLGTFDFSGARV